MELILKGTVNSQVMRRSERIPTLYMSLLTHIIQCSHSIFKRLEQAMLTKSHGTIVIDTAQCIKPIDNTSYLERLDFNTIRNYIYAVTDLKTVIHVSNDKTRTTSLLGLLLI